jgi:hypothetical protein
LASSQRSGVKVCGSGKICGLSWMRTLVMETGVPGGGWCNLGGCAVGGGGVGGGG